MTYGTWVANRYYWGMKIFSRCLLPMVLAESIVLAGASGPKLELGANVNESLTRLDQTLLDRSHTTWVRGFLPASEFIAGQRRVKDDPGILTLERCAHDHCKVIVSLKWDFKRGCWRAPAADSPAERDCFIWTDALCDQMRGEISMLSLVNEAFEDTQPADLGAGADGQIPLVNFLKRLAAHVAARGEKNPQGAPLPLYCGGFTRLDTQAMETNTAALALLNWCEADARITGVDFHMHQENLEQFQQTMVFLRQHVPTKPLIVTEFSLIWNYRKHLEDRLEATPAGAAFARKNHLGSGATVRQFINQSLRNPVPEETWTEFLRSQRWFDPDYLERSCQLMEQHGVVVATYAFSQHSSGGRTELGQHAVPWLLNAIFIPLVAVSANTNQTAVNRFWFDEYVRRQLEAPRLQPY